MVFDRMFHSARWWAILLFVLVTLFAEFACHFPEKESSIETKTLSIINGKPDLSQPAIGAFVVRKGASFCTGTLISQQLIVTAAHCIDAINRYGLAQVQFRTDVPDPAKGFRSEYHEFLSVAKHPKYRAGAGATYDIAVVVLKKKAKNVKPIPANVSPMLQSWVGKTVRVVGYGLIQTQPTVKRADQKYAADIPLIQIDTFSFIHFDQKTPVNKRKSACHGDSGGPSLFMVNGKQRVMGVTSIAYKASPGRQSQTLCDGGAVSTRTDAHMGFLRKFLLKYGDGPESCKTSVECGSCGQCNQKNLCEPKPVSEEKTSCQACKTDADCGSGICYRFANGFRCLQACTKESCCPSGATCGSFPGRNVSKTVCMPDKAKCPAISCKVASECGLGEMCDTTSSLCVPKLPPRTPELCQACKTHKDCGSGLCQGPVGRGFCSQPCGVGGFCPDGFVCQGNYAGLPKQCVPKDKTCRLPCVKDTHCPTGFACKNKFCERKGGGEYGDSCGPMACKAGLKCVSTTNGKICLQACGIEPAYGGKVCPKNGQCKGGARCYQRGGYRVCIAGCKTSDECKANGGGSCSASGNCLCNAKQPCAAGFVCNYFTYTRTGPVGACVPKTAEVKCPNGFACQGFRSGQFCVEKAKGGRAIGDSCDSLNKCKDGLRCLNTTSGPICFEDCTKSQTCSLGGKCLRISRSSSVCLCQGKACPQGRVCKITLQGYGYCAKQEGVKNGCINEKDCPVGHICKAKKCVVGELPKPPSEPVAEPSVEPVTEAVAEPVIEATSDGGSNESIPEAPKVESSPEPAPKKESVPDTKKTEPAPDTAAPKPSGGCGCEQSDSSIPEEQIPISLLLLFGLFFFGIKRKMRSL